MVFVLGLILNNVCEELITEIRTKEKAEWAKKKRERERERERERLCVCV